MVGVIAAVGLAFWSPLSSEIHSHTERITKAYARSLQTDVLDEVRHQVLAQVRFAELLATEPRIPTGLWESQARLFLTHHAGYVAVQWIDENGLTLGNVSADGNRAQRSPVSQEELQNLLHDLRRDCREDAKFTSPAHLANGNTSRDVVVPICRNQQSLGVLLATIDESRLLTQILEDDVGLGYGIATYDGNEQIFITPSVGSNDSKRWAQQAPVDLPGAPWRIIVWPESVMLQQINSRLPEVALLTGSLIGLLLFTTLDFARTSYFRSQELRRAHDELESRVEQRTAELTFANKELEAQIRERKQAEESLQELSGRLLQLRDEEQRRIARELHDSTVQIMGALAIDLERLEKVISAGDTRKAPQLLADSSDLVERATTELRTISYLLHPPILDDLGLEGVLPWYAAGFSSRSGIKVNVKLQSNLRRLTHELELALFRIVQECLTNIHRHSGSPTAEITVSCDPHHVTLQIVDHGKGIPPGTLEQTGHPSALVGVGIAGMRERVRQLGGQLRIVSSNTGTTLTADLPIAAEIPVSGLADNPQDSGKTVKSKNHSDRTSQ